VDIKLNSIRVEASSNHLNLEIQSTKKLQAQVELAAQKFFIPTDNGCLEIDESPIREIVPLQVNVKSFIPTEDGCLEIDESPIGEIAPLQVNVKSFIPAEDGCLEIDESPKFISSDLESPVESDLDSSFSLESIQSLEALPSSPASSEASSASPIASYAKAFFKEMEEVGKFCKGMIDPVFQQKDILMSRKVQQQEKLRNLTESVAKSEQERIAAAAELVNLKKENQGKIAEEAALKQNIEKLDHVIMDNINKLFKGTTELPLTFKSAISKMKVSFEEAVLSPSSFSPKNIDNLNTQLKDKGGAAALSFQSSSISQLITGYSAHWIENAPDVQELAPLKTELKSLLLEKKEMVARLLTIKKDLDREARVRSEAAQAPVAIPQDKLREIEKSLELIEMKLQRLEGKKHLFQ